MDQHVFATDTTDNFLLGGLLFLRDFTSHLSILKVWMVAVVIQYCVDSNRWYV